MRCDFRRWILLNQNHPYHPEMSFSTMRSNSWKMLGGKNFLRLLPVHSLFCIKRSSIPLPIQTQSQSFNKNEVSSLTITCEHKNLCLKTLIMESTIQFFFYLLIFFLFFLLMGVCLFWLQVDSVAEKQRTACGVPQEKFPMETAGDGNCCFRALSLAAFGSDCYHNEMSALRMWAGCE
jgi:hypothetical protein